MTALYLDLARIPKFGPDPITDEKLTRAVGTENSDPAVAEEFVAAETRAGCCGPRGQHGWR
jgi:hypothetical protein